MGSFARMAVAMAAVVAAAALPAVARGHDHPPVSGESALMQTETAALGADHAQEHAMQREALQRWMALPAAERAQIERRASRQAAAAATRIAAALPAADQVGRWETQTIPFPTWALNAVVVATGEVMFWGRAPLNADDTRDNVTEVWLWHPRTGALDRVPVPLMDLDGDGVANEGVPFFCSGQSLLPSGEVLLTGGNLAYPSGPGTDFAGLNTIYSFDPWTRRWTEQPRMRQGRWYPTQVELADGRTVVVAGYDESGAFPTRWNDDLEVFVPAAARGGRGQLTLHEPAGSIVSGPYPHLFTLPDGKVLLAGQDHAEEDAQAALLDPARLDAGTGSAWSPLGRIPWFAKASQAALLLGARGSTPRVTVIGGYGRYQTPESQITAVPNAATLAVGQTTWTRGASSPTRTSAGRTRTWWSCRTGCSSRSAAARASGLGSKGRTRPAAIRSSSRSSCSGPAWTARGPSARPRRSGARTTRRRSCCRTVACSPPATTTGRSATPQTRGPAAGQPLDQAEIYSPPYLFDGESLAPRPAITSLPPMGETGGVLYGERFGVGVTGSRPVDKAVLVAPAATTHGVNMNQRRIELEVLTRQPGGLEVRAPATAALAPPGWYMLFVLDASGTPSEAGWVWMRSQRPAAPARPDRRPRRAEGARADPSPTSQRARTCACASGPRSRAPRACAAGPAAGGSRREPSLSGAAASHGRCASGRTAAP